MSAKDKKIALTITANTRQLKRDMRSAGGEVRRFERQVTGLGAKMRGIRMRFQQTGIFGRGGGALKTAAGFAGVFGFQQMTSGAKEMDASLTDIAITGKLTNTQLVELKKLMFDVSNATGKSTNEVLSFVSAMTTATGDTAAAMVALKDIGDVAVSTGTDMGALGQVFVKLTTSMKILPKEARQAFNILRSQEMVGAITMAQLATALPEVVGSAGIMGKSATGLRGVSAIGGLMQMTRRGTSSVEEAKTASSRFLQDMYRNRKKMKKHLGVDIMDKGGNVRDLTAIFGELATAMAKPGMLGKTLEKGIFNVRSIKTATQLAMAGRVGLSGKQGTLKSFKEVFGAGKTDEIAAGKKKREASAAWQYEQQMTILSNALKKHMLPLFGQIAKSLKEWGPDLVKTIKFLLDNSRGLLKLWLGYKGVTFFKNFMAPIQGGAGGAASAVPGMMRGAGAVMLPNGQMIGGPAGRANFGNTKMMGGSFARGYGFSGTSGAGGGWVRAGRSGGSYYTPGGFGMAGMGGPMVAAGGAWGSRGGRNTGRFGMFRRAGQRFGGWAGGAYSRYGGRATRMGGMGIGAAGMMGMGPQFGPEWANMGSNAAMMSNNPYAIAAGAAYKANTMTRGMAGGFGRRGGLVEDLVGNMTGILGMKDTRAGTWVGKKTGLWGGASGTRGGLSNAFSQFEKSVSKLVDSLPDFAKGAEALNMYYGGKWRGFEEKERQDKLMEKHGFKGDYANLAEGGYLGMSAIGKVGLAKKLGQKGLKTLSDRIGREKSLAKAAQIRALRKGGAKGKITEEQLEKSEQYFKLKSFEAVIDRLIMVFKDDLNINIKTVSGQSPGDRVNGYSIPAATEFAPGGTFGA